MRVFITGGTGFIGSQVIRKLTKEKHELFVLSENLANANAWKVQVKHFRPEAMIHLAWEGIPDYSYQMSLKNLRYGIDLFEVAAKMGCKKIISTGSCWEYGTFKGTLNENMAVRPFNAFTAAKNSLHWLGKELAKENDIKFVWARLFFVYGPGQRKKSLIPYLIDCARKGIEPRIKNYETKNDFVYVEDVAEAITKLLSHAKSGTYNVGSGKATSVHKVCKVVYQLLGREKILRDRLFETKPHQADNFWADISRMKQDVRWLPKTDLKQGIKKMLNY
ncbi:hypothetical protein A2160_02650 [Candidatus Beckwithbacteria bacterium RBG_13_42_9]|uniref:NAD-dependent epimerase/dehydratase domain-containing protein n=1 Tax=Candidatus Beckwithbacteria bacterium RBG_13_42_9 TaxID=1797457 RepID=A0A1F5E7I8_9BACT|nr:MAG: hypothetical protein A2160_02650 [Candidatus Beckwithbacteria bacterium RBG_13_42_9]